MKKILLALLSILSMYYVRPQGCVAVRNVTGISPDLLFDNIRTSDKWVLNLTNRYFEAPKTYRGDKFITDTLVRNKLYTLNVSVFRMLPHGWSFGLSVPISANSRKNYLDHGGLQWPKHTTRSFGLGDIRLAVYK